MAERVRNIDEATVRKKEFEEEQRKKSEETITTPDGPSAGAAPVEIKSDLQGI